MEAEKVVEKHAVWYAVYTNSRAEKRAGELLLQEGIENYVPIVKVLRQWSDRKNVITSYSIHYTKLYESFTFSRLIVRSHQVLLG